MSVLSCESLIIILILCLVKKNASTLGFEIIVGYKSEIHISFLKKVHNLFDWLIIINLDCVRKHKFQLPFFFYSDNSKFF
jgi:hypothetical protein